MSRDTAVSGEWSLGSVALLAVLTGVIVVGYGLLVLSVSVLGGAWIAAIGLSMLLAGAFAAEWAGDQSGLSAAERRRLSTALAAVAIVLLVAFVVVNGATFEGPSVEQSG